MINWCIFIVLKIINVKFNWSIFIVSGEFRTDWVLGRRTFWLLFSSAGSCLSFQFQLIPSKHKLRMLAFILFTIENYGVFTLMLIVIDLFVPSPAIWNPTRREFNSYALVMKEENLGLSMYMFFYKWIFMDDWFAEHV